MNVHLPEADFGKLRIWMVFFWLETTKNQQQKQLGRNRGFLSLIEDK
jgi:hypothetical protein